MKTIHFLWNSRVKIEITYENQEIKLKNAAEEKSKPKKLSESEQKMVQEKKKKYKNLRAADQGHVDSLLDREILRLPGQGSKIENMKQSGLG